MQKLSLAIFSALTLAACTPTTEEPVAPVTAPEIAPDAVVTETVTDTAPEVAPTQTLDAPYGDATLPTTATGDVATAPALSEPVVITEDPLNPNVATATAP